MGIKIESRGNWSKTTTFLTSDRRKKIIKVLKQYADEGINALREYTPVDTGKTASSWFYEIVESKGSISLVFKNSNIVNGVPIAVILQYGHGTKNGGYVTGIDYINPAIQPVFDKIADMAWNEVKGQ